MILVFIVVLIITFYVPRHATSKSSVAEAVNLTAPNEDYSGKDECSIHYAPIRVGTDHTKIIFRS